MDAKGPSLSVGAPTPSGPAQSKRIAVTTADSGIGFGTGGAGGSSWFVDAATACDGASFIANTSSLTEFTSGTPIVIDSETRNGRYLCVVASDRLGNATYARSAEITGIDTTDPGITFPSGVTPTTGVAATIALSDGGAEIRRYGAIEVAGSATGAAGCATAALVGANNLTTLIAASTPVSYGYTPPAGSAGRKVCVYAEDAAGNSRAALWTTAIAQAVPGKPAGVTATAGDERVALSWDDPGDATITKHQYRQQAGGAAYGSWTDIPSSAPGETNATSYTVTGLVNGTAYRFRIRAVNAGGHGAESTVAGPVTPADTTGPAVAAIAVTSSPPARPGGWYTSGNAIEVEVTFDEAIAVTGTPELKIRVGAGADSARTAACARKGAAGDDAKKLVCSYTVAAGDEDTDGISVERDKLSLPGSAAIKDAADNGATLTYAAAVALGAQGGHKVDAKAPSIEVGAPAPSGPAQRKRIAVTTADSGAGLSGSTIAYWYVAGATACDLTSYLAAVTGRGASLLLRAPYATPAIAAGSESRNGQHLCFYTNDRLGNATYARSAEITGIDTTDPVIAFPPDVTPEVAVASTVTLTDAGAKIRKYGAITVAGAETDATGCDTAAEVGAGNLTTLIAAITPVSYGYTPATDSAGRKVCVYAEDAAGNSRAALWTTAIALPKPAQPTGLAATAGDAQVTLTWTDPGDATITKYQVSHRRQDAPGAATWTDITGSGATTKTHAVADLTNGVLYWFWLRAVNGAGAGIHAGPVAATPVAIDTTGPSVSSIAVASSPPASPGGWYKAGNAIEVEVAFDEAIAVTGTPELGITVGTGAGSEKTAACARKGAAGDDAKKLVCTYTVAAGDEDANGFSVERDKLSLPGSAAIKDAADNDATLTYAAAVALGDQGGHKVDAKAPSIEVGAPAPSGPAQRKRIAVTTADSGAGLSGSTIAYWYVAGATACDLSSYVAAVTGRGASLLLRAPYATPAIAAGSESRNGQHLCFYTNDRLGNATYARSAEITGIDTTDPEIAFPPGVTPTTGVAATVTLTDAGAKIRKYGAITVSGAETDATGCDTAAEVGADNLTKLTTPDDAVSYGYTPPADSAGRKVCVYAEDAAGNSGAALWTTAIALAKPAQPTGLAAAAGDKQVTLTWTDPDNATITKYQVSHRRQDTPGATTWTDITGSGATTKTHTVADLTNGVLYWFWLRAVNGAGAGIHAGPVAMTPADTTGPAVSAIAVTSSPSSTPGGWYTSGNAIDVEVTFDEAIAVTGTPELGITVGPGAGSEKTANCARKGSTGDDAKKLVCTYTVAAGDEDANGISVERDKLSRPSGVTIRDSSNNDATLTYAAAVALGDQSGHKVDAKGPSLSVGDPVPSGPAQRKSITATFTDSGVGVAAGSDGTLWFANATTECDGASLAAAISLGFKSGIRIVLNSEARNGRYFCFRAKDRLGNTTYAKSAEIAGIDTTGPGITFPTGVTPTTGVAATIALSDAGAKIRRYGAITVAGAATRPFGCATAAQVGAGNLTTLTTPDDAVDFRYTPSAGSAGRKVCVYAEDAAGNRNAALWGTAIAAAPLTAPVAPTGLSAAAGDARVELTWTDPGDASITKYQYRQQDGGKDWGGWTDITGSGASTTRHTVSGLMNGTAYRFRIRAANGAGDGAQSDVAGPVTPRADRVSFTPSASGWFKEGDTVRLTIVVTPGALALNQPLKIEIYRSIGGVHVSYGGTLNIGTPTTATQHTYNADLTIRSVFSVVTASAGFFATVSDLTGTAWAREFQLPNFRVDLDKPGITFPLGRDADDGGGGDHRALGRRGEDQAVRRHRGGGEPRPARPAATRPRRSARTTWRR